MISLRESIHEAVKWGDDHYDRLLCPGLQPSQSKPRGSGPEVLKRERGHVTSETGVAEVAVFGALQPNVSDYRYWHYQKILQRTSRNFQRLLYRNSNQKGTVYFNVFFPVWTLLWSKQRSFEAGVIKAQGVIIKIKLWVGCQGVVWVWASKHHHWSVTGRSFEEPPRRKEMVVKSKTYTNITVDP